MKTFVWTLRQDINVLMEINTKGKMQNYPVDANTVEDAITMINSQDCLRETNISATDIYAIVEAMQHHEGNKPKEDVEVKQEKKKRKTKKQENK